MIKSFPLLYSLASTGKVQTWQIHVDGDSYYTESGQLDGKITKSEPTICFGKNSGKKNATTASEQAYKDAESKFNKQKKTGYFEDINEVDQLSYIEPMLAKSFNDYKNKIKYPVFVQCKYNGGRCVANSLGLKTRKGEMWLSVPHIVNELKGFFAENPDAVLDGELFNYSLRQQLSEIMSIIRRNKNFTPEHFERSRELIKLYVYDGYGFNGITKETPYEKRKQTIDEVVKKYEFLEFVETHEVNNEEELMKLFDEYIGDGQEGVIVRIKDSPYENKRSKYLLKLKPTDDAEFEITSVTEGSGDWAGVAKIIGLKMDDGRTFNGTFKGNKDQAKFFIDNKDNYIGKRYTCFFNGFTSYGIPNSCQFDFNNSVKESDK